MSMPRQWEALNERPQKRGLSSGGWSIERRRSGWTPVWTRSRRLSRRRLRPIARLVAIDDAHRAEPEPAAAEA
jgi:hypothetical protein